MIGQRYIVDTPPAGSCPALERRFVVGPGRSIGGCLARFQGARLAALPGQLAAGDSFRMTVNGAASGTAQVTGRFTSQISTIAIHGNAAGLACGRQTFSLRLARTSLVRTAAEGALSDADADLTDPLSPETANAT